MGLTRLAIFRPLAMLMLILGLVLMGGVAFTRLRVDRLPPQSYPVLSLSVGWAGASPEDVESLLLQPLEDAVSGLPGLAGVTATAREASGSLFLQFAEGTNTDTAAIDAERRLASVRNRLPSDASAPVVRKFDPNASPIMNVAFTGGTLAELYDFAKEVVEPALLSVPGVADVSLSGGLQQDVRVTLDPVRLEAYKLSVEQVQTALVRENVTSPIGAVDQGRSTVAVRSLGLFQNLNDLSGLIVSSTASGPVYLRNVAAITQGKKTQTSIQRFNGQDAVGLSIVKQSDANTLEVAGQIRAALEKLDSSLPDGAKLVVTNDASRFVRTSLEAVERDLMLSIFLTATVLMLFLHSWRNTFIVVLAIPTSLISTFLVMYIFGFSLNLMTLMALAMTIGILVDDSIVVLENIHRHLSEGEPPFSAALNGRNEIGMAAMAITFTDIVVYIPVAFTQGNIGQLFIQYGLTIVVATLFSLFVSFTLTPLLASRWARSGESEEQVGGGPLAPVFRAWEWGFQLIRAGYVWSLGWSLRHRPVIVLVGVAALGVAMAFIPLRWLGVEFAPAEDDGQFSVSLQMPPDANLTATNEAVVQLEALLGRIPEVRSVFASVGSGGGGFGGRNSANLAVELVDKRDRTRGVAEVMAQVRTFGRSIPEATVRASASAALGGGGGFVQVVIMGDDLATLGQLTTQVQEVAKTVPGVADAQSSAQARQSEDRFVLDRERASALGVTGQQVGSTLRTLVQGTVVSQYKPQGQTAQDITLIGPPLSSARSLTTFPIASGKLGLVRVAQVTKLQPATSPVTITRTDRKRSVNVSIVVAGRPLGDTVTDLRASLTGLPLPPGYRLDVRGSAQQLDQAMAALTAAMSLSVIMMYMLLVALYESWLHPLAIMFSLPVSLVGAFGGLMLTGNTINIFSMMGMIALMGLVAKNAILLVDYTNTLRARGLGRSEALVEAGSVRLRPIAMTTLTVIFAMIPLALKLEAGGESRAPMAMVIIGGSISSTLLTLVLVPVMYTYLDSLQARFGAGFALPIPFRRRRPALALAANGAAALGLNGAAEHTNGTALHTNGAAGHSNGASLANGAAAHPNGAAHPVTPAREAGGREVEAAP